jgi:DNA repair protein RadC
LGYSAPGAAIGAGDHLAGTTVAIGHRVAPLTVLNPDARPRERLVTYGPRALSDAELLAVVLGSGSAGVNVIDVAQGLLARGGGLGGLSRSSLDELRAQPGVGVARGAALLAALELGRRAVGERPARGQRIASAVEVWMHLRARLSGCAVEEFWALALDVRHRVLWEACLARGSLTGVEVHPRDVFRPLIRGGAAAVVFCHNHPSGDPSPSRQDLELTLRLRDVGELCGIAVLDHVVVGADGYTSLARDYWTPGTNPLQSVR